MSESTEDQSIQGPLLIKIQAFPKAVKNKRCFADCNEECPKKSYTIFDPKPRRRSSSSKSKQSEDSSECTLPPRPISSISQKKEYIQHNSKSSTVSSIYVLQEQHISEYKELNAAKSEQSIFNNSPQKSIHSEIKNTISSNIEQNMARNSETHNEQYGDLDQKLDEIPSNKMINSADENFVLPYSPQDIEIAQHCVCSDFAQGQKRKATGGADYPRKLLRACNKNAIKFCGGKSNQGGNPDYTIEISVELAQNKKKNVAALEQKKRPGPNEALYMNEKSDYPDLSKYQKVDCPSRIAKVTDRRTLTARQPKSMDQPEEISISVDTSRVEISTDDGKQTLLKNKRTTKIRSLYSEWDTDTPGEKPKAIMDNLDRKRKPLDSQHSDYIADQNNISPEYAEYTDPESRRDDSPDEIRRKVVTQNQQLPTKISRDSTQKSDGSKQMEGYLYKRTTKMRTDGDKTQPDKFSVISEVEEGHLNLAPQHRTKTPTSETDSYPTVLYDTDSDIMKRSRLSRELDDVMDPDQWSFEDQDIVEKRRHLFERARQLSAGLLERARTLSAGGQSDRNADSLPPMGSHVEKDERHKRSPVAKSGKYQEYDIPSSSEGEQVLRESHRPLHSAPPRDNYEASGTQPPQERTRHPPPEIISDPEMHPNSKFRSIGASTFSPLSLLSFAGKKGFDDPQDRYRYTSPFGSSSASKTEQYEKSDMPPLFAKDTRSKDKYPHSGSSAYPGIYPESETTSRTGSKGKDERHKMSPVAKSEQYHEYDVPPSTEGEQVLREGRRPLHSAPPSSERDKHETSGIPPSYERTKHPPSEIISESEMHQNSKFRSIGASTFSPLSLLSFAGKKEYDDPQSKYRYTSPIHSHADSSRHSDRYPDSEFRGGSRDMFQPSSPSPQPDIPSAGFEKPSRSVSRDRYLSSGSDAQPDQFQRHEISSRAGSRDKYPPLDSSAQPGEYREMPSRADSKDKYLPPGSSEQDERYSESTVPSRASSREKYLPPGVLKHPDEDQKAELSSRAGSGDRYPPSGSSVQPDGYDKSEIPTRAGSRDRYPSSASSQGGAYQRHPDVIDGPRRGPEMSPIVEADDESGGRYPPSKPFEDGGGLPERQQFRDVSIAKPHSNFREMGASTTSPMSIDEYIENRKSSLMSPQVSFHPKGHREPDVPSTIEPDHDSRRSNRRPDSVEHSQLEGHPTYAEDEETKPKYPEFHGHIAERKSVPKSGCVLQICVLEKHIDGCRNKKKIGEEGKFCDYDIISRQIFQTCQGISEPIRDEEDVIGKAAVGALQAGKKRPPKTSSLTKTTTPETELASKGSTPSSERGSRTSDGDRISSEGSPMSTERGSRLSDGDRISRKESSTEQIIAQTKATPVYSERKGARETDSAEEEMHKPSETESVASEATSVDTYAKEEEKPRKEDERRRREEPGTESPTKTSIAGSDKEKSDVVSETDTYVSSVTSKKSSFSGHIPDFRSMPVKPVSIDRKPTSMFSWFRSKK